MNIHKLPAMLLREMINLHKTIKITVLKMYLMFLNLKKEKININIAHADEKKRIIIKVYNNWA